jgi:drug/metabolite transporter (DMT)-like permease
MYWTVWMRGATFPGMDRLSRHAAYGALLVTAVLWGSNAVVARGLLGALPPAQLACARWLVVLACLAPLAWVERARVAQALREDWRAYATLALLGFAPQTLLVYTGLAQTTAVVIGLLNSAIPVLIVAVAALWHGRRPRRLEALGLTVSSAGVLTIVAHGSLVALLALRFNAGDVIAFAGMSVWALYTLRLASRPRGLSLPLLTFVCALLGVAMIAPLVLVDVARHGLARVDARSLAGIAYLGLLPSLAATLLWTFGVARLGAVKAGVFTHLVPVFSALFATAFLGERLHPYHAAGFVLVAGGALCCLVPAPMLSSPALPQSRAPAR